MDRWTDGFAGCRLYKFVNSLAVPESRRTAHHHPPGMCCQAQSSAGGAFLVGHQGRSVMSSRIFL